MESFAFYKNFKIHYTDIGSGPTVVLLHGFTESLGIWEYFRQKLSEHFRVVCIDLPGHGKSDTVSQVHTMEIMAECVRKVLEKLHIQEIVLVGHSMGGYVSLAFADIYPEMLKGLGLFHSTAYADSPETLTNRMRTNNFVRSNHHGFLCEFIPSLFTAENQGKYATEINELIKGAKNMTSESIIAANTGMAQRPDRTHVLKNANYPILFIAGKHDSRVSYEKVLEQVALCNESTLLFLRNVAHMGYIEAREKTFYAVKTFAIFCYEHL